MEITKHTFSGTNQTELKPKRLGFILCRSRVHNTLKKCSLKVENTTNVYYQFNVSKLYLKCQRVYHNGHLNCRIDITTFFMS